MLCASAIYGHGVNVLILISNPVSHDQRLCCGK